MSDTIKPFCFTEVLTEKFWDKKVSILFLNFWYTSSDTSCLTYSIDGLNIPYFLSVMIGVSGML